MTDLRAVTQRSFGGAVSTVLGIERGISSIVGGIGRELGCVRVSVATSLLRSTTENKNIME